MDNCRVCGGNNLEQFLDLGSQAYCNSFPSSLNTLPEPKYPLRVWFCNDCTAVQLDHTIPKEQMFGGDYKYVSGTTKTLRDSFQNAANRLVERFSIGINDLVLDIGSNDGTWLKSYNNCRVLGVEPSDVAELAMKSGINTIKAFFNLDMAKRIAASAGFPKLITGAGIFLHLEELHSVVEGIKYLLGRHGTFYLQAMYIGDMIKHTEFDIIYHEHINYWSLFSLCHLFNQHGLEINDVGWIPIHGGSLELWITKKGKAVVSENVDHWLIAEKAEGLHDLETYHQFESKIWRIGEKLLVILEEFKADGKRVHALGAPAKGATLLNSFHIDTNLVECAVERNQLKVGHRIAGTGIPIWDEDTTTPPDAYLVLAWNFLPELLSKKRDYIMNGGTFIVPIPDPFIVDKSNYERYAG